MTMLSMDHSAWIRHAIGVIEADNNRSTDTHLIALDLPIFPDINFYLKDESSHPTGSLKHRLARSLFLYALCNGWIGPYSTIIEASSGSTAVSEAYFARLLDLPFIAVMPRTTSPEKIARIEFYGGRCHFVDDPNKVVQASRQLALESGGHFMDQFTYAERATDWRGNNNIAESIFNQMRAEPHPIPTWLVCGAGTGGTSATLGRYVRYRQHATKICVADPEYSVLFDAYLHEDRTAKIALGSRIEGIGRPRVEPSFVPSVVDAMVKVPDAYSLAAIHWLYELLGRRCGGSTGTIFCAMLAMAVNLRSADKAASIVGILCDGGERYLHNYYNQKWLHQNDFNVDSDKKHLQKVACSGGGEISRVWKIYEKNP